MAAEAQLWWSGSREGTLAELYAESGAARWGISREEFGAILLDIGAKYLGLPADERAMLALMRSLKLADLALARGCAAGNEPAWDEFMGRFREKLYDAARGIAREDAAARELADSLYADLYGTTTKEGERQSKLRLYNGRGSLEGWLRTVLAQSFVDSYRKQRKLVSLEAEEEQGRQFVAPALEQTPQLGMLEHAVDSALWHVDPEARLVLAWYYLDGKTLAEIGRMLGVHESTVSRRVEKIHEALRKHVRKELRHAGLNSRQAEEMMREADARDMAVDIRKHLTQEGGPSSFKR